MDLKFAVIGPGSVGTVLIRSLRAAGHEVVSIVGRDESLASIPANVSVTAICTPDDTVVGVATTLAESGHDWHGRIVCHVSGALSADALDPLGRLGADVLSFHPLSSYPPDDERERTLAGTIVALEGQPEAVDKMTTVAESLGARPIHITRDQKPAYHLAASIASNFLATIAGSVHDILVSADLDQHIMDGLIADTVENLKSRPPGEALTGPIVRGDVDTVRLHLTALQKAAPAWAELYRSLAASTIRLARTSDRIDSETEQALLAVLVTNPV